MVSALIIDSNFEEAATIIYLSYLIITAILSKYIKSYDTLIRASSGLLIISIIVYHRLIGDTRYILLDITILSIALAAYITWEIYKDIIVKHPKNMSTYPEP